METLIPQLLEAVASAYDNAGWLAAVATLLMFGIRIYRVGAIQDILPAAAQWSAWPMWARYLVPFLLAFAGSLILALVGKVAVGVAIAGALTAALSSIGMHKGTKALGKAESAVRGLTPGYQPSPFRKIVSAIFPIDKSVMAPMLRDNEPHL